MCMAEYDPPVFYREVKRKAVKSHSCNECSRIINVGEHYYYVSSKYDGELFTNKTCQHCYVAQQLLVKECNGFLHCGVLDDLREHFTEALPWRIIAGRLIVGMRRKWRRFDNQGLMSVMGI